MRRADLSVDMMRQQLCTQPRTVVWVPRLRGDDSFQRDKFCSRKFSAVLANTCMLASRSALPVSSVIASCSDDPATAMQLWPAASP